MKVLKYLLLLMMAMGLTNTGYALEQDENPHEEALNERDWEVLREYLKSKREEKKEETTGSLVISGDVRTEWRHMTETLDGKNIRGRNGRLNTRCLPISKNDFDIEFNLRFDYTTDRTWAVAAIEFDNSAGVDGNDHGCYSDEGGFECKGFKGKRANLIRKDPQGFKGSGACDDSCLKKAYFGWTVWECGEAFIDVELGRRNLYNAFDSRVQFLSRFDGLLVRYENDVDWTVFYWQAAGFVIDERVNQFAWATELGLLDICESGIDLKYSLIDWRFGGHNRCNISDPNAFRFLTSQWTFGYNFDKDVFKRRAKIFAAYLYNHSNAYVPGGFRCPREDRFKHKRDPKAWYAGFSVGEVVKEGDWAFEVQYQWVGATAMPDEDAGGIGTGNVLNKSLTANGYGNTNFRGWRFEALYALTDNLSVDTILEFSKQIKKSIGCVKRSYSKFEVEFIYAF